MRLLRPVGGMTLRANPGRGLVAAEASLASMLAGHCDEGLSPAQRLPEGAERARAALESLGVVTASPTVVLRLDLAAELCFQDARDGLAFLNACQRGLHLAGLRQVSYYANR
jgi:hypothetical protein